MRVVVEHMIIRGVVILFYLVYNVPSAIIAAISTLGS